MSDPSSTAFGGLKDFSVDAQRRMFVEQQERERREAESRRTSRKIKQATAGGAAGAVALSGMMANFEGGGGGGSGAGGGVKKVHVGDDDDDSIADDWSMDSEESFYVGIARADYAQPDNLEMYGEGKEEDYEPKEDRLGISRVSIAIINRENKNGRRVALDWDSDIPIHEEKHSSLHEFMNGTGANGKKEFRSKKDHVVAMPIVGTSLDWNEEGKLGEDDDAINQVYQHKAAEGKAFIDKLVGAPASTSIPNREHASTVASMKCPPTTPGMTTPGVGSGGNYPVLSPMMLFSPGITTPGANRVVEGEDNGVRQMRERELRRESLSSANMKLANFKEIIVSNKDSRGKVDAYELMKQLEKMMEEL